jgi:hypothetical protein
MVFSARNCDHDLTLDPTGVKGREQYADRTVPSQQGWEPAGAG